MIDSELAGFRGGLAPSSVVDSTPEQGWTALAVAEAATMRRVQAPSRECVSSESII